MCRGVDPTCYDEWGNGWTEGEAKRILIWSRTAGPRHAHLGTPLAAGSQPARSPPTTSPRPTLIAWAAERGIAADYTEDLSQFRLSNYQAVVFLSSNRDTLDDTAQTTLMQYIRGGGGFVGIHNAFGAEYSLAVLRGSAGRSELLQPRPEPRRHGRDDQQPRRLDLVHAGDVAVQGRVVQPGAVPELRQRPARGRPGHERGHGRRPRRVRTP